MMERTEVLDMMGTFKLYGMKAAYDETLAAAVKRSHEPRRFVGDLLKAEISEKQARSIKHQLTVAKLPLAKDVEDFPCKDTPINEARARDLVGGAFIVQQRNVVLVGGTGAGKRHLAIAIARELHPIRIARALLHHRRSRQSTRGRKSSWTPGPHRRSSRSPRRRRPRRTRLSALRPGRWAIAVPSRQPALRARLDPRHDQSRFQRMAQRVRRSQDDDRAARPPNSPLATSSRPATKAGASRTAPDDPKTAPHRPALAPAAQPQPASPRPAPPAVDTSERGRSSVKIQGPGSVIIDSQGAVRRVFMHGSKKGLGKLEIAV